MHFYNSVVIHALFPSISGNFRSLHTGLFKVSTISHSMSRVWYWGLPILVALSMSVSAHAQGYRPYPRADQGAPPRTRNYPPVQFADPDRAANAAREATGGRVLGVEGDERDGRPGYRVRILEPRGRVRNFHYDPSRERR